MDAPPATAEETLRATPSALSAGSATVVITPTDSVYLAGAALGRKSTTVHDDLYARCLVLRNEGMAIGFVSLDLIGFFYSDVEDVRARLGPVVDHLVIAATHNHSGPDTLGLWGPSLFNLIPIRSGRDERYVRELKEKVDRCLRNAKAQAERVRLRFNSLLVRGFSQNIRRANLKDDELTVMQVQSLASGRTVAVLYNFAAHPEIFLQDTVITADFPYFVNRAVERHLGGVPIFVNGAIGGLVTVDLGEATLGLGHRRRGPTFDEAEAVTAKLAAAVVRAVVTSQTEVRAASMLVKRRTSYIPLENRRFLLARYLGVLRRELDSGRVKTALDRIDVGPAQFVTVPGEVLPEIGFALKRHMRGQFKFVVGLGNDELGYIMRRHDFRDPLYAYEQTMSVGPGAAVLEDELIEMLRDAE